MVESLSEDYPVSQVCKTIESSRSFYYYKKKENEPNIELKKAIEEVVRQYPSNGYRMTAGELRQQNWEVTDYKVYKLMQEMGLAQKKRRRMCKTTNSDHNYRRSPNLVQGRTVTEIDEIWSADITYVRLGNGFIYLAVVMDITTRMVRGWSLSRSIDHYLTLEALELALEKGVPQIHHSDQGIQYSCPAYTALLDEHRIEISMADAGQAWQNGYCELLIRTIKQNEIDLSDYRDFQDAYNNIERFIEQVYMHKRVHSSLGYLPPAKFEEKCRIEGVKKFTYK